jgi:uncharacterized protein
MDETHNLQITHDKDGHRFYATLEGKEAELTYTLPEDGVMDFNHTFVPKNVRGNGFADQLIEHGLDYAKDHNFKAIASCPAVKTYIKRHPEYENLIKKN